MERSLLFFISDIVFSSGIYEYGPHSRLGECEGMPILFVCSNPLLGVLLIKGIQTSSDVQPHVNIYESDDGQRTDFAAYISLTFDHALKISPFEEKTMRMFNPKSKFVEGDVVRTLVFGKSTTISDHIKHDAMQSFKRNGGFSFVVSFMLSPGLYSIPPGPAPIIRATTYSTLRTDVFLRSISHSNTRE